MFEFRKYYVAQGKKKIKHPKLIVDEDENEFGFMGLTHSKKKGKNHNNFPLLDNPQLDEYGNHLVSKNPYELNEVTGNYLRRKVEYDIKENFGDVLSNYSLSDIDKERVKEFIKNKIRKH
ncbi:MAG: hypothetical protein MJ250_09035 [Alphaproteobacteria bacterium]|nr:hypothetical protein [Alphaproteobacteria bacterium]